MPTRTSGRCPANRCGSRRDVLLGTAKEAAAKTAAQVYPGDDCRAAGNRWCAGPIVRRAPGGTGHDGTGWRNRTTRRQAVGLTSRR
ncbi:hypothetical protein SUDANB58_01060 [Streptomyces sp. enrichment culture]|uniref:hypothetical protein n=1 Tax=Streptomyces sp. enrichment culture TaxID=1795815 RepID=UPI003F564EF8